MAFFVMRPDVHHGKIRDNVIGVEIGLNRQNAGNDAAMRIVRRRTTDRRKK
jgi:hypothetical protein